MEEFQKVVFNTVRQIPKGRVTSYGAIARAIGVIKSARLVGWVLNTSHGKTPYIPAHRVVNRQGLLTGKMHFGGGNIMQELLEAEGIRIVNDKVINFDAVFWDPLQIE